MSGWEILRHVVAISGRVSNSQTGKAVGGARVEITDGPSEFTTWLETRAKQFGVRWLSMLERPDRTQTAGDGHFHFMDLPNGNYTLAVSLPGLGSRYGAAEEQLTVTRDGSGNIVMATADIQLPPTTLKGAITTQGSEGLEPVVLAEVRVAGSGEQVYSNEQGHYLLSGLETGSRKVLINAKGYQTATQTVEFDVAGVQKIWDAVLVAQT